jgi:hypothetical protein
VEVKEQYQVNMPNKFASLGNFDDYNDDVDISRAWVNIREAIKATATECLGYYEL